MRLPVDHTSLSLLGLSIPIYLGFLFQQQQPVLGESLCGSTAAQYSYNDLAA